MSAGPPAPSVGGAFWPDLHLHVEGAARWGTLRERVPDLPAAAPWGDPGHRFRDFAEFVGTFVPVMRYMDRPEAWDRLVTEALADCVADGVTYVEASVGLRVPLRNGLDPVACLRAARAAFDRANATGRIAARLVLALSRNDDPAKLAPHFARVCDAGIRIDALDLLGVEDARPARDYRDFYAEAARRGWKCKAHAGEQRGPAAIAEVLEALPITQIGHGLTLVDDPGLLREVARRRILVECCPVSNWKLRYCERLADHPLPRLAAAGVPVAICSDDPLMFGGWAATVRRTADALGLSARDLDAIHASTRPFAIPA